MSASRMWQAVAIILMLPPMLSLGDEREDLAEKAARQARLEALTQDIKTVQARLVERRGERDELNDSLRELELALAEINRKILAADAAINDLNRELDPLLSRQRELRSELAQQQEHIAVALDAAYRRGGAEPLKVILGQQDPDLFARNLRYYRYIAEARRDRILHYRALLDDQLTVEKNIAEREQALVDRRAELARQHKVLADSEAQRRAVLVDIERAMDSEQAQLEEMQSQRKTLESILARLEESIQNLDIPAGTPFPKLRGKLPWPVTGRVAGAFGARRAQSIVWKGWLIDAAEGAPVAAVHNGRVVFSDYLRGHGLVLILDHGDNYLSLYAHNQVLLKDVGEWVKQGEALALAGTSGGLEDSALYFEIRHNGQPQDPKVWLTRR